MSAHTPGPWELVDSVAYGKEPWNRRWLVTAPDPKASEDSGYKAVVVSMHQDGGRCHADARLISAAPSLLAALERALHAQDHELDCAYFTGPTCDCWRGEAEAAVKQAKGEA